MLYGCHKRRDVCNRRTLNIFATSSNVPIHHNVITLATQRHGKWVAKYGGFGLCRIQLGGALSLAWESPSNAMMQIKFGSSQSVLVCLLSLVFNTFGYAICTYFDLAERPNPHFQHSSNNKWSEIGVLAKRGVLQFRKLRMTIL